MLTIEVTTLGGTGHSVALAKGSTVADLKVRLRDDLGGAHPKAQALLSGDRILSETEVLEQRGDGPLQLVLVLGEACDVYFDSERRSLLPNGMELRTGTDPMATSDVLLISVPGIRLDREGSG